MTGFVDWRALDAAVKARVARADDPAQPKALTASDRYQQFIFDRFLTRVFAADDSPWLLKGGTSMLARVADARRTRDVDLTSPEAEISAAVEDLRQRIETAVPLDDHLTFVITADKPTGRGEGQPDVDTRQVSIEAYAGQRRITRFHVDVAVGPAPIGEVEVREPVTRLELGRPIQTRPYRLYPIVDQIAEKVRATMSTAYPTGSSSRVKDLVDLVVIARSERIPLRALQLAIATHRARARLPEFETFTTPADWERRYASEAAGTAAAGVSFTEAVELVREVVDPALVRGELSADVEWTPAELLGTSNGDVWVSPHSREGHPVVGHWRRSPQR